MTFFFLKDMLENGNGALTLAEQRSHFTAWALNKSPLLIGTDVGPPCSHSVLIWSKQIPQVTTLSTDAAAVLLNPEIIAINQDDKIAEPLVPFFWGKYPDGTWNP